MASVRQTDAGSSPDNSKVFCDPIHGHMELHPLCVKIIDTPQFQRLRNLKQLGACYFVFPGAAHNRFEHCLGVCYLAGKLVELLKSKQPTLEIHDKDVLCVKIAGLCHDLGHGPFSHVFDNKFLTAVRPHDNRPKHEELSEKMLHHLIQVNELENEFKKYGLEKREIDFIIDLIVGKFKGEPYYGKESPKRFLYEIVANARNGVDVDKWDYFARDCHNLGIRTNFDHTRFMQFVRVVNVDGEPQICVRDKEVHSLYDMFYTRHSLHRRAYRHKTTDMVEDMLCKAFQLANAYVTFDGENGKQCKLSETVDDMVAYTKLDDNVFFTILHSKKPQLYAAQQILQKIQRRQLYHLVGQAKCKDDKTMNEEETETLKNKICQTMAEVASSSKKELNSDDIVVMIAKFDYGKGQDNPVQDYKFYSKSKPDAAFSFTKEEVSAMLPGKFSEEIVRVYCKNPDCKQIADESFNKVCDVLNLVRVMRDPSRGTEPVPGPSRGTEPVPQPAAEKRSSDSETKSAGTGSKKPRTTP